jgi:SSS family solute:Na+ symporter
MDWTSLGIQTNFTSLDWCIVAGYIGAVLAGGVYIRRYVKNAADFMIAGRGLGTFVAAATMIATELGLVTVMYAAQKGFTGGFAAFHIALAATIMTLMVGLTGFIVVPLRRLRVTTIPEYYEKRFGRGVRILGGLILALSGILNMGLFLNSASLFVMGITGLTGVFHLKLIMTALLAMVLIYTSLGGMVSVVVLDYVQFLVLSFAFVAMSFLSIQHLGWTNIVDTVVQLKGEAGFNPFHSEGFGVSYVVWMFFLGLVSCAVWQTAVIRACAADSVKTVKKIYLWSAVGFLIRFLLPYFFGISALVYMSQHEGLRKVFLPEGGPVDPGVSLLAMPVFFSQILPVGVIGIVTAGMLAAFMSTHDSYLLCWSTVLVQDVVSPCFKGGLSPRTRLWLTRLLIPLIGLYTLVWGLWYPMSEDLWDYMAISGAIYFTGAFALLAFGLYWKRASRTGAYLALTAGFGAILGLTPVQRLVGMKVSSELVGLTVVAAAMALMVLGSVLFPDRRPLTVQEGKGVEGHAVLD